MAVTAVKSDGWAIEHTNLGTITLTDRASDTHRASPSPPTRRIAPDAAELAAVFDRFAREPAAASVRARSRDRSRRPASRRVAGGRARCAWRRRASKTSATPSRGSRRPTWRGIGARPGDILKITGTHGRRRARGAVGRRTRTVIQIDGTARSNCGAGLAGAGRRWRRSSRAQAVAVRLSPLWAGAAPAIIAPERMLEDLDGVPVVTGCAVRVPTFAKAVNFQVVRTIPSGPGRDRPAHRHPGRRRRADARRARRRCPTRTSAGSSARWRGCARSSSCR